MVVRILIPANAPDDWQRFLAEPDKQWKTGYSAKAMVYCWQQADGIPPDDGVFLRKCQQFKDIQALLVIPEHEVSLPGGTTPSGVLSNSNKGCSFHLPPQ